MVERLAIDRRTDLSSQRQTVEQMPFVIDSAVRPEQPVDLAESLAAEQDVGICERRGASSGFIWHDREQVQPVSFDDPGRCVDFSDCQLANGRAATSAWAKRGTPRQRLVTPSVAGEALPPMAHPLLRRCRSRVGHKIGAGAVVEQQPVPPLPTEK